MIIKIFMSIGKGSTERSLVLDRACAAKVVIYGHVSKTKAKPFQYGRTHYEVRLKSVVNRFPAHRVHHSETIIAVVAFSLHSLSKDRHAQWRSGQGCRGGKCPPSGH